MERLGTLLVDAGLLTNDQLAEALRAQVVFGGRLGTNLLELGFVDLDTLARALGTQQGVPAALARHFDDGDAELQQRVSPETARRHECVPLRHVFGARHGVVLAATTRLDAHQRAEIADEILVDGDALIVAIAAEMRIKYFLERVYQIPRAPRFLRIRGSIPPPASASDRRRYVDERAQEELLRSNQRLARGSRELAPLARDIEAHAPVAPAPDARTRSRLLDTIRCAADRDAIATTLLQSIDVLAPSCDAAALLLVRHDTAIGWQSFSRLTTSVPELVVPLAYQGLVPRAASNRVPVRLPFTSLHPVDQMLAHMLGKDHGDLVIVPIVVADHVPSLIACVTTTNADVEPLQACAAAAADALGRLVRAVADDVAMLHA